MPVFIKIFQIAVAEVQVPKAAIMTATDGGYRQAKT